MIIVYLMHVHSDGKHISLTIEVSDMCLSHAQSILIALNNIEGKHISLTIEVSDMCLSHEQSIQIALRMNSIHS